MFTHWWILLVQFLLLREEVQTLPQRDLAARAPLGDGQRQITEHIKCVGVVGAHWAVQRAPQLAREQVCERRVARIISSCTDQNDRSPQMDLLSLPTILLSSLSKCFFHMAAASSEILGEDKRWENIRSHIKVVKAWILNLFHTNTHTHLNLVNFCSVSFPVRRTLGLRLISVCSLSKRNLRNSCASCWLGQIQRQGKLFSSCQCYRKLFLYKSPKKQHLNSWEKGKSTEIVHVLKRLILSCVE